jgi:hypothetical protein
MSSESGPNLVTNGLVLCLDAANPLSYKSGATIWNDLTYNTSGGTLTNGPTFSSTNGGSIVFDGVDDYLQLPNLGNYNTNPITYEWVIKSTPNGNFQSIFCNSNDALSHIYITNSGQIRYYNGAIYETTVLSINTNIFKFITMTRNGTSVLIYINGKYQTNLTIGTDIGNFTNPQVGITNTTLYPLNGSITSFKLYNKTLNAQEILQNYNATKSRFGL